MRPIEKPACPLAPNGSPKTVTHYKYWKKDLETAIGMFCTYCGMRLNNSPQVEHVVPVEPKLGNPAGDKLAWSNVVFACGPCNGAGGKSNKHYNPIEHYMPEEHNTLLPFTHKGGAIAGHINVTAANGLTPNQKEKAEATIAVFNLGNIDTREDKVDYRSSERWQALQTAELLYKIYLTAKASPTYDSEKAARCVASSSASAGFFNVWVEVFINEPEVLKMLIAKEYHPGTHTGSFDPVSGRPIHRNPSNSIDPF